MPKKRIFLFINFADAKQGRNEKDGGRKQKKRGEWQQLEKF